MSRYCSLSGDARRDTGCRASWEPWMSNSFPLTLTVITDVRSIWLSLWRIKSIAPGLVLLRFSNDRNLAAEAPGFGTVGGGGFSSILMVGSRFYQPDR